jgi:hypothetical protein
VLVADFLVSLLISHVFFFLWLYLTGPSMSIGDYRDYLYAAAKSTALLVTGFADVSLWTPFLTSTMITSIWTLLCLAASMLVKLLLPVHKFTAWFFNVDRHPIRAIGSVAAGLVWIGALALALLSR